MTRSPSSAVGSHSASGRAGTQGLPTWSCSSGSAPCTPRQARSNARAGSMTMRCNITDILRRVREFDPTPGMRIVMAEDALLEARSHTRVAFLAEDSAPWEMVPPTWYANPSYTRCLIGAEPDEDPDSTESWVRQLASQPVDDTAA